MGSRPSRIILTTVQGYISVAAIVERKCGCREELREAAQIESNHRLVRTAEWIQSRVECAGCSALKYDRPTRAGAERMRARVVGAVGRERVTAGHRNFAGVGAEQLMRAVLHEELAGDRAFMPASGQRNYDRVGSCQRQQRAARHSEVRSSASIERQRRAAGDGVERDTEHPIR